jgi:hypothetical protein
MNIFYHLQEVENGPIIATRQVNEEPSPMWTQDSDRSVQWNWIAIFSYTASLVVSLAIWRELFLAVHLLVK